MIRGNGISSYPNNKTGNPILDISLSGYLNGKAASVVYVLGRRDNGWSSTSVLGDVAQYLDTSQALINTPTSQQLYLVSTNAADDGEPAGTGAQTVRVVYLNDAGTQTVATYTMNGTTPVSAMADATFIQWMEVATVGSNSVSVGNIALTSTNGVATVGTTFEFIKAGGNRSLSARYKVPTGYTAYMHIWNTYAISATMDVRLRTNVFADDRALSDTAQHFQATSYLASGQNSAGELDFLKCPAGSVIKASAIPGGAPAGNRCDVNFDMLLVAD